MTALDRVMETYADMLSADILEKGPFTQAVKDLAESTEDPWVRATAEEILITLRLIDTPDEVRLIQSDLARIQRRVQA